MSFYRGIQKTANDANLQIAYLKETAPHYFRNTSLIYARHFDEKSESFELQAKGVLNFFCLIIYYPLQNLAIFLFFFTTRIYFAILPYDDYLS